MKNKSPLHHILRIDLPDRNTFGWQVRTRKDKKEKSKYFSDLVHGGPVFSLNEAVRYRDKKIKI